jgi:hypothetical protein
MRGRGVTLTINWLITPVPPEPLPLSWDGRGSVSPTTIFGLRAAQSCNQRFQGQEQHAMAGIDSLDAQGHRQHGFTGTGRPEQQQIVAALDEAHPAGPSAYHVSIGTEEIALHLSNR